MSLSFLGIIYSNNSGPKLCEIAWFWVKKSSWVCVFAARGASKPSKNPGKPLCKFIIFYCFRLIWDTNCYSTTLYYFMLHHAVPQGIVQHCTINYTHSFVKYDKTYFWKIGLWLDQTVVEGHLKKKHSRSGHNSDRWRLGVFTRPTPHNQLRTAHQSIRFRRWFVWKRFFSSQDIPAAVRPQPNFPAETYELWGACTSTLWAPPLKLP